MDRDLLYPGQIGLVENTLDAFKAAMVAVGVTSEAILGASTQVFGLAASALSASAVTGSAFAISVGRGAIFSYQQTDTNAYGALGTDTATSILKTGINLAGTNIGLSNSSPATVGYSINYLVSAQFQEADSNPVSLPFYNSSGTPTTSEENFTRTQRVVFAVTGGTAAATGSQTTPVAPSGSVPIYVVTVTNGQTAVAGANIAISPGAPFISNLSTVATLASNASTAVAAEVATRIAQAGNMKSAIGVFSNTTLTQAQQGSFVEISAGSAVTVNLPTPVNQAGAFWRILNSSSFAQTLKTPVAGSFSGPGGNGTGSITISPGQLFEATSDNATWVLSPLGRPMPYYSASQSGTISAVAGTSYTIATASVTFPAFSRTAAFRVRGRMLTQGSMTGSGVNRQNFLSALSDGTSQFTSGANWLVTSADSGDSWGVSDYFESTSSYAPGAAVTFTMSTQVSGGNNSFTISGGFFELFVVEA